MSSAISLDVGAFRATLSGLDIKPLPAKEFVQAQAANPDLINQAAASLARNGFVAIRGFISPSVVQTLRAAVDKTLAEYIPHLRKERSQEFDAAIINCRSERFTTFNEMATVAKPIFNLRNGWSDTAPDAGFVDLFKPDVLIPELREYVVQLSQGLPAGIVAKVTGNSYVPESTNLYLNFGITQTRGFHIDSDVPTVKSFLYLTDVSDFEHGPYCFIRGSHNEKLIKDLNRRYNAAAGRKSTDMELVDTSAAVAFVAPAGTLIMSVQSGIHRGYPQHPARCRYALVQRFEPKR